MSVLNQLLSQPGSAGPCPILLEALTVWNKKHAGRALSGLSHVAAAAPELADELHAIGLRYHDHGRSVVRKAAKRLLQAIILP